MRSTSGAGGEGTGAPQLGRKKTPPPRGMVSAPSVELKTCKPATWKLTHLQRPRRPHRRAVVLHRVLHLLEGAHLDLAHAPPPEAEFPVTLPNRDLSLAAPAHPQHPPRALLHHG